MARRSGRRVLRRCRPGSGGPPITRQVVPGPHRENSRWGRPPMTRVVGSLGLRQAPTPGNAPLSTTVTPGRPPRPRSNVVILVTARDPRPELLFGKALIRAQVDAPALNLASRATTTLAAHGGRGRLNTSCPIAAS